MDLMATEPLGARAQRAGVSTISALDRAAAPIVSALCDTTDAIVMTGARMIDVASGVEREPGVADPERAAALLDVVRSVRLVR